MATPSFTTATRYTPRAQDFIVQLFCNERTACFDRKLLPAALSGFKPGKEKGAAKIAFVGTHEKKDLCVYLARLDAEHTPCARTAKKAVAQALEKAKGHECKRVVVLMDGKHAELCAGVQEGALLGGYVFDKYLQKKKKPLPVLLVAPGLKAAQKKNLAEAAKVYDHVNFAREVLNEPSNAIDPHTLAAAFRKLAQGTGLKVAVWDRKRLQKESCGGILAVGAGSKVAPRLVIGEYKPAKAKAHLALVGKGVTFDTGGYCLKPGASQSGMKMDMGGAATMFPAACAIAKLKLPIRVTVYTPLVRNDISSTAYHVNDILRMRAGKTVQVDNTDAEGRLILADALALAGEKKPDCIVDAATLTGACVVALGEDIAGVYGTDPEFTRTLLAAADEAGEHAWEMPLHRPYAEQLKTPLADCKNIGAKWGGSITAALFLHQFVPEGMKWIHLDIAGPGIKEEPLEHLGKGAKGWGVKTVVALARKLAGKS